jgi:hypothetical protein
MANFSASDIAQVVSPIFEPAGKLHVLLYFTIVAVFYSAEIIDSRYNIGSRLHKASIWFRYVLYICAALAVMNLGVTREIPFIYFQF